MERHALVLGIYARHSSANSLPQERERSNTALDGSNQIKPNQTCGVGWMASESACARGLGHFLGQFRTREAVGETPTAAVETTALPSQTQSKPVKPIRVSRESEQTKSGRPLPALRRDKPALRAAQPSRTQPGQTQSKPVKPVRVSQDSEQIKSGPPSPRLPPSRCALWRTRRRTGPLCGPLARRQPSQTRSNQKSMKSDPGFTTKKANPERDAYGLRRSAVCFGRDSVGGTPTDAVGTTALPKKPTIRTPPWSCSNGSRVA
jgi:hypothetical protein